MRHGTMKCYLLRFLLAIAGGFALLQLDAQAQPAAKVYRIGVLEMAPPDLRSPGHMAFYEELRLRGYVEGRNLVIERRNPAGRVDALPALARELVALRPDLIVALTPQPTRAVKDATSTIPIVMAFVADPVGLGLAASLARPGGNLTGVATLVSGHVASKGLQLLHEVVPSAKRFAVLINPTNEMHRIVLQESSQAALQLGVQLQVFQARATDEIEPALQAAVADRAEALVVIGDSVFNNPAARVPQLVARSRLPALYLARAQVEAGGLMSFGPDFTELSRRVASYVDRILRGANPGELAIEQPTKFQLVINLKTAKTLGLTIPQSLLLSAELIE
jgi:putative tryptophan/tyrosine transport system substrate-binding protein